MPVLDREEYIEQAYFWRTFYERLREGVPGQEIIAQVHEEILSTTKLPMALDVMLGELRHRGKLSDGLAILPHYFSPFQRLVLTKAEDESVRFDTLVGLKILEAEADYRSRESATLAGLFLFQFECVARNRLGYHDGMKAIAEDAIFNEDWRQWIRFVRQQLGAAEFCEFLYMRSEFAVEEQRRALQDPEWRPETPMLFGVREGRIAKANRGKDPLYMFAALQRQLSYPAAPKIERRKNEDVFHPMVERRFQLIEKRMTLVEQEQKGGIDLSPFYAKPESPPDPDAIV